jgi:hypothetical protein
VQRDVEVNSIDGETLLVDWSNELLRLQETQRENCSRFDIPEISDKTLARRDPRAPARGAVEIAGFITAHITRGSSCGIARTTR